MVKKENFVKDAEEFYGKNLQQIEEMYVLVVYGKSYDINTVSFALYSGSDRAIDTLYSGYFSEQPNFKVARFLTATEYHEHSLMVELMHKYNEFYASEIGTNGYNLTLEETDNEITKELAYLK